MFSIACSVLAAVWLLDALRLRGRIRAFSVLTSSDEPAAEHHVFLCAPGVVVDPPMQRAASAFARREGLDVLDLIPHDLSTWHALAFTSNVDPAKFRRDRFAKGYSAGFAMLVDAKLARNVEAQAGAPRDLFGWALQLKHYATTSMSFAIAPGLHARGVRYTARAQLELLQHAFGELVGSVLLLQLLLVSLALAGPGFAPIAGSAALAILHLQALVVFAGSPMHPCDLTKVVLLRAPLDLWNSLRGLWLRARCNADEAARTRRAAYAALIANGTGRFFEPRRADCPLCGSSELVVKLETRDIIQHKPGRFRLERCRSCAHVFQNPRLSLEGLDFYYRDFYDGLGGEMIGAIFAAGSDSYLERARSVASVRAPRTWLDVGAGHGHFCCIARDVWPHARFDGLDFSESIELAAHRGWIDHGYRGLFPELAPQLARGGVRYDVVSMSHYLEHTRDPRAEIAAASGILEPGGALMIEVPDPESRLGNVLGRYWLPWMQPQHQHFVSVSNLARMLKEEGFEVARWYRGEAHLAVDFLLGTVLALHAVMPRKDEPWRPQRSLLGRAIAAAGFWASAVAMLMAWTLDRVAAPLLRRPGWSNTYRVVARKVAA